MKKLAITLAALLSFNAAHAAEVYRLDNSSVAFVGEVADGDADKVREVAKKGDTMYFHSPGGLAVEGFMIGQVLSDLEIKTSVTEGNTCLSACAFAFLGGTEYTVTGILGFHEVWSNQDGANPDEQLDVGQEIGVYFTNYILANGFNISLATIIGAYTNPELFYTFRSTEELMAFYVRSEADRIEDYLKPLNVPVQEALMSGTQIMLYVIGARK